MEMTQLNEEFHNIILPVIIGFVLCNFVGFLGNIIVIYVYFFRYEKSHYRLLVLALSIVDLTSCCTTVPMETVSTWFWFDAPSSLLCKVKNLLIQSTGLSAMFMLFVMGLYKFRRICKPFSKQITKKMLIILCIIGVVNSIAFSIPTVLFWSVNNRTMKIDNASSEDVFICEVDWNFLETSYPRMYQHLLSAYNIFLVATIVFYIFIAKKTVSHFRHMRRLYKANRSATITVSVSATKSSKNFTSLSEANNTEADLEYAISVTERLPDAGQQLEETEEQSMAARESPATQPSKLPFLPIRKVIIMTLLSGAFAVTFLFGQIFGYTFAIRGFEDYTSLLELRLFFVWYRLYFINYALNPVIYFALDRHFRRQVIAMFRFSRNA